MANKRVNYKIVSIDGDPDLLNPRGYRPIFAGEVRAGDVIEGVAGRVKIVSSRGKLLYDHVTSGFTISILTHRKPTVTAEERCDLMKKMGDFAKDVIHEPQCRYHWLVTDTDGTDPDVERIRFAYEKWADADTCLVHLLGRFIKRGPDTRVSSPTPEELEVAVHCHGNLAILESWGITPSSGPKLVKIVRQIKTISK
jgi:hypothetical protein